MPENGLCHAQAVRLAADALRQRVCGDVVSYVVNRNINYTNVCTFKCQFCAFSKGKARFIVCRPQEHTGTLAGAGTPCAGSSLAASYSNAWAPIRAPSRRASSKPWS